MATDIELIEVHTPSRLPSAGTITRKSRTSRPPDRKALSTFIRTEVGPGLSPRASPGSAADACVSGRSSSPLMGTVSRQTLSWASWLHRAQITRTSSAMTVRDQTG